MGMEGGVLLVTVIDRITMYLNKLFELTAIILLVFVIIASSLQVFTRYALNASMTGTEEFARYCFVWLNMLGASLCVKTGSHAVVSILNDKLKNNAKEIHTAVIQSFIIISSLLMIVQGLRMVFMTTTQLSPTLRIPMCYIYLAVPVGGIGILFNAFSNILFSLQKIKEVNKL